MHVKNDRYFGLNISIIFLYFWIYFQKLIFIYYYSYKYIKNILSIRSLVKISLRFNLNREKNFCEKL